MMGKLAQLPPREKAGLVFALVLVMLVAVDRWVTRPLVSNLRELDAAIEVASTRLAASRQTLAYLNSVEQRYAGVKDLIGVSGSEQESIESFKNEIDEIAQRNGVRLRSMRHLVPEVSAFLVMYVIEISDFEAEAVSLINFLNDISEASGLIRVRNLVVGSQRTDTEVSGSMLVSKVMTLKGDEDLR